jgi:hypothetical protein
VLGHAPTRKRTLKWSSTQEPERDALVPTSTEPCAIGEQLTAIPSFVCSFRRLQGVRACSRVCLASFRDSGLKQLDGITGRILKQNLLSADPHNNVVAEMNPMLSEQLDPIG